MTEEENKAFHEREQPRFEAWIRKCSLAQADHILEKLPNEPVVDGYKFEATRTAWWAWCAAKRDAAPKTGLSYHDLHITTAEITRTSIFNLPYRVQVHCTRVGGWQAWAMQEGDLPEAELGGEYGGDHWLVLDVDGYVICDSKPKIEEEVK